MLCEGFGWGYWVFVLSDKGIKGLVVCVELTWLYKFLVVSFGALLKTISQSFSSLACFQCYRLVRLRILLFRGLTVLRVG